MGTEYEPPEQATNQHNDANYEPGAVDSLLDGARQVHTAAVFIKSMVFGLGATFIGIVCLAAPAMEDLRAEMEWYYWILSATPAFLLAFFFFSVAYRCVVRRPPSDEPGS